MRASKPVAVAVALAALACAGAPAHAAEYFHVRVVGPSGAPVSGAVVSAPNHVRWVSDANGNVAIDEPDLAGRSVFFRVSRGGYQAPDVFAGIRGFVRTAKPGATEVFKLEAASTPDAGAVTKTDATRMLAAGAPDVTELFRVTVRDRATGRGVPLVELRLGGRSWVSDSAGEIAFYEIDSMGKPVAFELFVHGYHAAGGSKLELEATPGARAVVELERDNLAERLYRITGAGIYADSVRLGLGAPIEEPLLDREVTGQDSVVTAVYGNQLFWIWGDTTRVDAPLGTFSVSGATSKLPRDGGLAPDVGVNLAYFADGAKFVRSMATGTKGGATWFNSLQVYPEAGGAEGLYATFAVHPALTEVTRRGVMKFDDAKGVFAPALDFALDDELAPAGTTRELVEDGVAYALYDNHVRVPLEPGAITDRATWRAYGPTEPDGALDLDADGRPRWAWRAAGAPERDAPAPAGVAAEDWLSGHARDEAGAPVKFAGAGSTAYDAHRERWVRVVQRQFGPSSLIGDLYYFEADSPLGPWVDGRLVVAHDDYTFYNPLVHPEFSAGDAGGLYFEATYTLSFSGTKIPTPRYDYNQVMYRLDRDDERAHLPVPIYDLSALSPGLVGDRRELRPELAEADDAPPVLFRAPDRAAPGAVPVYWSAPACKPRELVLGEALGAGSPAFWALPADADAGDELPGTTALYAYERGDERAYRVESAAAPAGFTRATKPLARVWTNPVAVRVPVHRHALPLDAIAGDDQCLRIEGEGEGTDATVTARLDASKSRVAKGEAKYAWRVDGAPAATGAKADVELERGLHVVELTVTAGELVSRDEVLVLVERDGEGNGDGGGGDGGETTTGSGGGGDGGGGAAPGGSGDDAGCGCRAAGASARGLGGLAGLALALALAVTGARRSARGARATRRRARA